jgi:hypothetical protein
MSLILGEIKKALATRSRGYTDETRLRGLKILDFLLVHGGGLRLCSSEFYSPNNFQTLATIGSL